MKKICLLSDTHGKLDNNIIAHLSQCDEIWHAGDIGSVETLDRLKSIQTTRAVYGNIDPTDVRQETQKHIRFTCEDVDVWMTHIGGYPNNYDRNVKPEIFINPPKLFVCGHSHILKVIYDKKLDLLHMNPGAIGFYGFHKVRTMLCFDIDKKDIKDLKIIEYKRE